MTITILGLIINLEGIDGDKNISMGIKAMENIIKKWDNRKLTPFGKITVIKSLIISKLTHLLSIVPFSKENIDIIETKLFTSYGTGEK